MKKRLFAIVAVIMSLFLGVSVFSGCGLLTKDNSKDMEQVVATVQIDKDAPLDEIKKQQLMIAYMNYGYYYVSQGSYTQEQVINMMVDNLITTRILVQNAMYEFNNDQTYPTKNEGKGVWDVERYLTIENTTENGELKISDLNDAKYSAARTINDLIDGYEEKETTNYKKDGLAEEVRAVPTNASNASEEVTDQERFDYISKNDGVQYFGGIDIGAAGSVRRVAYTQVLKLFEVNGLLGDYDGNSILTTAYYQDALKNAKESVLIGIYESRAKEAIRNAVTFESLETKYAEMYEAQRNLSATDYKTQVESATAENPILYHPAVGYGYVYNLLLGVDSVQEELIKGLKDDNNRLVLRRQILSTTKAKDLRSTWITSGYDFDIDTKKFTGDYTMLKDGADSLPFYGTVTKLRDKTDDNSAEYRIDSVQEFGLDEFINMIDTYLYGGAKTGIDLSAKDASYYKVVDNAGQKPANFDDKVNELLFAFSTDPGSLNTYQGYKIDYKPDLGEDETYMQEFANAGRELLEYGDGSYAVVATDYGYHIMFFSKKLSASNNYDTLKSYLTSLDGTVADWKVKYNEMLANWEDYEETDSYLYTLAKLVINQDDAMSTKQNQIVKKYKNDQNKVVKYADRYADMKG